MKYVLIFLVFIQVTIRSVQSQCSGSFLTLQDSNIGSITVAWRYNLASNTVQFIAQGQTVASINLRSTYLAVGWSNTAPTMANMDVAMFFPGTQVIQDRFSRGHGVPTLDPQQDFCVMRTNVTDRSFYVAFERFMITNDVNDIALNTNIFPMFALGPYTYTAATNTYQPSIHSYRLPIAISVNLLSCTSFNCARINCTLPSCPCLQNMLTGAAECVCFPPSPCIGGTTVTPSPTVSTIPPTLPTILPPIPVIPGALNGSCSIPINPCSPNGVCLQVSPNQYICQCLNNFTGLQCQTTLNLTTCLCLNGGTCLPNGICQCDPRFVGQRCQLNNPCWNYCRNGGNCSTVCSEVFCSLPVCTCVNGTSGAQCELNNRSTCPSNPCVNGICSVTINGGFMCTCTNGYFGPTCNLINSCISNPCIQGTCIVSSNCIGIVCGYSCICPNGTIGTQCEIGGNACFSSPCRNNGTCVQSLNSYRCQCSTGFAGPNCDQTINVCTPNPCLNGGICIRSTNPADNQFRCICSGNYFGGRCEFLSPCSSSPCRNGGQCVAPILNCSTSVCPYTCVCNPGYTGVLCQQQSSSCLTTPCLNGGICTQNLTSNLWFCACPPSSTGLRCETVQPLCTSNSCSNGGFCYIDVSSTTPTVKCICLQGFTGQRCEIPLINNIGCSQNPCGSNGTCIPSTNSTYYCLCPNGATGLSCPSTNAIITCSDFPCRFLSTCQSASPVNNIGYRCHCPDYLTGDRCQYPNVCRRNPCFNQGTCIPLGPQNSFLCACLPGFGNYDCSMSLGLVCSPGACLNGGSCQTNGTFIRCICPLSFTGPRCEWTSICSSTTCFNGGTCRQTASTIAECLCPFGFTGPTCAMRDSCANFPCKYGGGCASLMTDMGTIWSVYRCTCPPATFGQNCEQRISSCSNLNCPSFQICNELGTGPICTCAGNKVGTFCQYDNPCGPQPTVFCSNGGTCIASNTDPPVATCLCREGFTGPRCSFTSQSDACSSNPCDTRGFCALSSTNNSYACICRAEFVGDRCEIPNPCQSTPCLNQAICQPQWNASHTAYSCRCVGLFTGTRCETSLLNPCSGLCMNGSPCVNGVCVCPPRFTGTYCGLENPCFNPICRNGGLCAVSSNTTTASFTCVCPNFFTGLFCENLFLSSLNTSCIAPCLNGGSCSNGICICPPRFIGPSCQYENPCNTMNPCLNSGTCFGRYNLNGTTFTQCFCLNGFTGSICETPLCGINTCNGGTCIAAQNSFVCNCPPGRTGDRCQFPDICLSKPCSSNEFCQQTANQYQCITCFDRSPLCAIYQTLNQYCSSRYILTINNTLSISVLEACPKSCFQCRSTFQANFSDTESIIKQTKENHAFLELNSDRRSDCSIMKELGFCRILIEKYPLDCAHTCRFLYFI